MSAPVTIPSVLTSASGGPSPSKITAINASRSKASTTPSPFTSPRRSDDVGVKVGGGVGVAVAVDRGVGVMVGVGVSVGVGVEVTVGAGVKAAPM